MSNRVSQTISDQTLNRIIQIESAGNPLAKAPTSSATGLFQFLNATWLDTVQKHRPDWLQGHTRQEVLALRVEPTASIEMGARFTEDNARALGRGYTDADIYLAHFSGVGVARKLLRASVGDPCSKYYSAAAIAANRSILQGKTVGQVRAWAAKKMAAAGRTNWIDRYWTEPAPAAALLAADEPPADAVGVKVEEAEPVIAGLAPEPTVVVPPVAATPAPSIEIEIVQRRLADMNYSPGGLDGKWGGLLAGAIGGFKNDRHLAGAAVIDATLIAELEKAKQEGFKRPIAESRANATEADLAPKVQAVRESWRSRISAKFAAIGIGISSAFGWAIDQFRELQNNPIINKIVGMAGSVPWYVWAGGVMSILIFIWQSQNKIGSSTTAAFNDGRLTAGEQPAAGPKT